jgi:proline dehydrogenase
VDASDLLRNSLLQLSKQEKIRDVIEKAPVSRSVVKRFVPGAERAEVVGAASGRSTTSARTRPTSRRRGTRVTRTSRC